MDRWQRAPISRVRSRICRYDGIQRRNRWYTGRCSGRGSAWLERLVRDQEVGGSNPLAPTNPFNNLQVFAA